MLRITLCKLENTPSKLGFGVLKKSWIWCLKNIMNHVVESQALHFIAGGMRSAPIAAWGIYVDIELQEKHQLPEFRKPLQQYDINTQQFLELKRPTSNINKMWILFIDNAELT